MKRILWSFALLSLVTLAAAAQTIQVNRENKTIYVTAEGEAKVDAEIATVEVGFQAYGSTTDALFEQSAAISEKVVSALIQAGLKREQIHTTGVSLKRTQPEEAWPAEWKKQRLFEAQLSWTVVVPVKDAEGILAIAMKSGGTYFSDVIWDVVDRSKVQATASKNALEKARRVAEAMASGLNAKLGSLIYASNSAPIRASTWPFGPLSTSQGIASKTITVNPSVIKLLPEKVEEKTTVYAVFAIE
jgi:uncharacterized protein YggE